MKKILVYSHDAYGLGNIRRMLEITNHLVNSDPELSVLLISGSPMLHEFRIPDRVDYIKLPCVARSEKGETYVKTLGISYQDTISLRAHLIMMAVVDFDPDLILVDKKPFGIADELGLALRVMRDQGRKPRCVLLLRDILDEPEATIRQWEKGNYHDAIKEYYDQVLVVGSENVFDAAREYCFPETTARKVRYCGYIRRPAPRKSPQRVREDFGLRTDRPLVLVTAGGGGDGYEMMEAYLRGVANQPHRQFETLLISGPEMSNRQREALFEMAAQVDGVVFHEFTDDMISCMNAADVVVSMGGYNTVCELLSLKKRMIIVPRVDPVAEQWMRAERMQNLGLLRAIHPDELTPESLLEAIEDELDQGAGRAHALSQFAMDGLARIGHEIATLMAPRKEAVGGSVIRINRGRARVASFTHAMRPRESLAGLIGALGNAAGA